jgi:hypothetical protein
MVRLGLAALVCIISIAASLEVPEIDLRCISAVSTDRLDQAEAVFATVFSCMTAARQSHGVDYLTMKLRPCTNMPTLDSMGKRAAACCSDARPAGHGHDLCAPVGITARFWILLDKGLPALEETAKACLTTEIHDQRMLSCRAASQMAIDLIQDSTKAVLAFRVATPWAAEGKGPSPFGREHPLFTACSLGHRACSNAVMERVQGKLSRMEGLVPLAGDDAHPGMPL